MDTGASLCSDPVLSRNSTSDVWKLSSELRGGLTAVQTFFILFMIIGFTWNLVVLAAIFKEKLFKSPTYIILLNLVASDILYCSVIILLDVITTSAKEFVFGSSDYERCYFCRGNVMVIFTLSLTSSLSLSLMSLDRLIYVKWPLKYNRIVTTRNTLIILAGSWGVSLFVSSSIFIPDLGSVRIFEYISCKVDITGSSYYMILIVAVGIPAAVLTVVANIWIVTILRKNRQERHYRDLENCKSIQASQERDEKARKFAKKFQKEQLLVTKVFGSIVLVSISVACLAGVLAIAALFLEQTALVVPTAAAHLLRDFQPVVHPLTETCFIPKGRKLFLKTLPCCRKRSSNEVEEISLK